VCVRPAEQAGRADLAASNSNTMSYDPNLQFEANETRTAPSGAVKAQYMGSIVIEQSTGILIYWHMPPPTVPGAHRQGSAGAVITFVVGGFTPLRLLCRDRVLGLVGGWDGLWVG
jgi:hypothetical protein